MSKKCVKCGTELEEGAVFCDECGAQQPAVQPQPIPNIQQPAHNYQLNQTNNIVVTNKKKSGLGTASLVCGIIALCTMGSLLIPEVLGIVFGIIAIKDKPEKQGVPMAGLVTSIIALLLFIVILVIASL